MVPSIILRSNYDSYIISFRFKKIVISCFYMIKMMCTLMQKALQIVFYQKLAVYVTDYIPLNHFTTIR